MTHSMFHLHECGVVTEDEEGRDLPDLESARHHAEIAARAIMCSELEDGDIRLGCHIEMQGVVANVTPGSVMAFKKLYARCSR